MLPYSDSHLTRTVITVFFIILLGYGLYEARDVLRGPQIDAGEARRSAAEPLTHITGRARAIIELSMNGKPIPVTEDGAFDEPYLLAPGTNRILLDARDRYGRTERKVLEIDYFPSADPYANTAAASSTATSTQSHASTTDAAAENGEDEGEMASDE